MTAHGNQITKLETIFFPDCLIVKYFLDGIRIIEKRYNDDKAQCLVEYKELFFVNKTEYKIIMN